MYTHSLLQRFQKKRTSSTTTTGGWGHSVPNDCQNIRKQPSSSHCLIGGVTQKSTHTHKETHKHTHSFTRLSNHTFSSHVLILTFLLLLFTIRIPPHLFFLVFFSWGVLRILSTWKSTILRDCPLFFFLFVKRKDLQGQQQPTQPPPSERKKERKKS